MQIAKRYGPAAVFRLKSRLRCDRSFWPCITMAKPAKKPATFVAKAVTALGRSQTYKRCAACTLESLWHWDMCNAAGYRKLQIPSPGAG